MPLKHFYVFLHFYQMEVMYHAVQEMSFLSSNLLLIHMVFFKWSNKYNNEMF